MPTEELETPTQERDRLVGGVTEVIRQLVGGDPWRHDVDSMLAEIGLATGATAARFLEGTGSPDVVGDERTVAVWTRESVDDGAAGGGIRDDRTRLVTSVRSESRVVGFIVLDRDVDGGAWAAEEASLVRLVAEALSAKIDRQAQEREREEARRMAALGRMAAGVAHDFNNLLLVFSATTELNRLALEGDRSALGSALAGLKTSERAVNQATSMVRRLMDFGRGRAVRAVPADVMALVEGMESRLRRTLGPAIRFEVVASTRLSRIAVDPVAFEQVLVNLICNARDALPEGGHVEIGIREEAATARDGRPGPRVVIEVRDDGIGIPAPIRDRVFEPFFTTKSGERGTGLGLAIVYANVKAAGGSVCLVDVPGPGTVVRVELPVAVA